LEYGGKKWGKEFYPKATELHINADGGGSNSSQAMEVRLTGGLLQKQD